MSRRRRKPESMSQEINLGDDYTPEEVEFLKAIDRFKRERNRPFPTWREVLGVLKGLGYRKVGNSVLPSAGGES